MPGTPSPTNISTQLQRIAEQAREAPQMAFNTLAHHIDIDVLREAFRRTRKNGATGVDGVTAAEYAANLDANLESLLQRLKSGSYRAPPVRRVYIPKGDGKSVRPLGIPTLEDKVLQRAVVMVLEQIYEQDFLPCSMGFRPGRSARQAVGHLRQLVMSMGGGWVIDLDIKKFFDTVQHDHLRSFLDKRIRDGVIRRVIGKWLNAGILEGEDLSYPEEGTPQGGVISPLLANIYLHEVLDTWFEQVVKPRLRGQGHLIRYADDAVLVLANEEDAKRVMEVLPKRMARFGLAIHPEKTKLVRFEHPQRSSGNKDEPGSFNFLGFTLFWGSTLKGGWAVKTKTAKDRFKRGLLRIYEWCRDNRHSRVTEQYSKLAAKVRGHAQYFGLPGNSRMLRLFTYQVERMWKKWLSRRSQRQHLSWGRVDAMTARFPPLLRRTSARSEAAL